MAEPLPLPSPEQPEDPREEFFAAMGQHVGWLHFRWNFFVEMFGSEDPDRVEQLNRRTGFIFGMFEDSLRDSILLDITKTLDPAETRVKKDIRPNLSFARAISELGLGENDPVRLKFCQRVAELKTLCDPILVNRNRFVAHLDRATAVGHDVLPGVTRDLIGQAVDSILRLYNEVQRVHTGGSFIYWRPANDKAHVAMLVRVLKVGNEAMDANPKAGA